ncbi:ribonuclease III domain-containing protein [Leptolyngbya ohadii]|uniref:ribonuclease III domain-containing protein n=1 Tax=Leptolyngbya ohadii TaxID=1962290 RepID=UPI000B5A0946|nr:ribonuclease III domain-containing protein [Leptolyngbya ohadii]
MAIEQNLGYFFFDKEILQQALITPGYAIENQLVGDQAAYQVLGDRLIQTVVIELLIRYGYSEASEIEYWLGQLVSSDSLSSIAQSLQLDRFLRLSSDEQADSLPDREMVSATLQAVVGGVYFDGGFRAASEVVKRWFQGSFTKEEG